jgi:flagellar biosynthesis/type III secretory pathway protein FliH
MGSTTDTAREHRYQLCRDEYCERFPCRVYKEGQRDGFDDGYTRGYSVGFAAGYSAGHAAGYREGFQDGVSACPRNHSG